MRRRVSKARLAAVGVAVIALVLLAVVATAAAAGKGERDRTGRYLVRLSDLGPGYRVGNDSSCALGPTYEGASPRLRRFNDKHRNYHGCEIDFLELWQPANTGPRPKLISSVAIRFSGLADARAAFRIGPEFADYNFGISSRSMKRVSASRTVGNEFRIFRTNDALVQDAPRHPAVITIWRTGRTVSIVLVSGKADAVTQEEALRLAETQQRRVLTPTPLPAHANDDRFVPLNNPTLDVPVHWLGLRFRAPRLPRLTFARGEVIGSGEPGPGNAARISYAAPVKKNPFSGIDLQIWRPAAWAKFTKSRTGRLVWAARCTKGTRVSLPTGYAILFSGHTKHQKRCGRRPDRFVAHVYLPDTVVAVNTPNCSACIDRGRGPDPWDSLRGMRAIANGLTIRRRE